MLSLFGECLAYSYFSLDMAHRRPFDSVALVSGLASDTCRDLSLNSSYAYNGPGAGLGLLGDVFGWTAMVISSVVNIWSTGLISYKTW